MIEKIKAIWEKIKSWFKKNWMIVVNYLVIFIAYSIIYGKDDTLLAEALLGLWLFISAAYGAYKWFIKKK